MNRERIEKFGENVLVAGRCEVTGVPYTFLIPATTFRQIFRIGSNRMMMDRQEQLDLLAAEHKISDMSLLLTGISKVGWIKMAAGSPTL